MYAETLVLDDQSGDDITYKRTRSDATGSTYIDVGTSLTAPGSLSIRHSTNGKGSDATDRHLVQFQRTILTPAGVPRILTVNCTIAVPRDPAVTGQIVKDQVCNLVDFLSDGATVSLATMANVDSLLRGEA